MKFKNRSLQEWLEIEKTLNACHQTVRVMEQTQDKLRQLLPELSCDVVADLANDLISLNTLIESSGDGTVSQQSAIGQAAANQADGALRDAWDRQNDVGSGVA